MIFAFIEYILIYKLLLNNYIFLILIMGLYSNYKTETTTWFIIYYK